MAIPRNVENRENAQPISAGSTQSWDAVAEKLGNALEDGRSEKDVRAIVHQWSAEARRRDLAPEQFLVVIKSQFARMPSLRRRPGDLPEHNAALEHLVSMCIEEYFQAD